MISEGVEKVEAEPRLGAGAGVVSVARGELTAGAGADCDGTILRDGLTGALADGADDGVLQTE